ncbi:MAG: leucyl aminopeptidase [Woeseiaceae bacterium]|nr:leucyl aminopeptidase [Woeseiaceae bacterium]
MDFFTTTSKASRRAADCIIVGVYERGKLSAGAADMDTASKSALTGLYKSGDLPSAVGKAKVLNGLDGVRARRVVVAGLGKSSQFGAKQYRAAVAAAMQALTGSKVQTVANYLSLEDVQGLDAYYKARHAVQAIGDSQYTFQQMKSGRKTPAMPLKKLGNAIAARGEAQRASRGAEHAIAIVAGMALTKDLGNLPPNVCTPSYLARTAQKMARQHKRLTAKVLNEPEMKRLGMHSLLSVTAGTVEPAKMIILQYKGAGNDKPIVLVGKGVTFDSGGISLKPGPAMDEMKYDMGGAAGVLGTMETVAKLQLPVNLNVVVPTVENMPSGTATRPADIVKSMSGQTIEILNTDAEGRLILCDALTYSKRFKPEAIIDVATLTGACVIALGHHHTGVMGNSDDLENEIVGAGLQAEDRGWRLPLTDDYTKQLKSNFADFANVGGRDGGAITAGCFLKNFADGMTWAHLDIAGTAWVSGAQKGATGRPVPMLSEFILSRCGQLP